MIARSGVAAPAVSRRAAYRFDLIKYCTFIDIASNAVPDYFFVTFPRLIPCAPLVGFNAPISPS
jgi:hypothetical protein